MNIKNILQEIEQTDPEVYEKLSGRRHILKSFGSKVAVAALPLAIGSLFKKAYGKTTDTLISSLNFALELEYFEYNFYHTALAVGSNTTAMLIPTTDRPGFQMIEEAPDEGVDDLPLFFGQFAEGRAHPDRALGVLLEVGEP